jgi:hypothetical protein
MLAWAPLLAMWRAVGEAVADYIGGMTRAGEYIR